MHAVFRTLQYTLQGTVEDTNPEETFNPSATAISYNRSFDAKQYEERVLTMSSNLQQNYPI